MADHCPRCAVMAREIASLRAHSAWLEQQLMFFQTQLNRVLSAIRGVIAFIDQQDKMPSMPRSRLLPTVHLRLIALFDDAQGRL